MRLTRIFAVLAAGAVAVFLVALATPDRAGAASAYTLSPVEYGMELKTPDGRVVWDYMTKKPENIGLPPPVRLVSIPSTHPRASALRTSRPTIIRIIAASFSDG